MRSNSLGPLHQSQVGQEGVFVGGGRGWRAGGGRRAGGEEERRSGGPPSGVGVRVECEAAVVGEQGGEGDQVRLVAVPVLLQHVAGGGREEGGAAAGVPGAVGSVGAGEAAHGAGGVQLVGLAQRERQGDGLERLGRRQAHEGAVTVTPPAAPHRAAKQAVLLVPLRR